LSLVEVAVVRGLAVEVALEECSTLLLQTILRCFSPLAHTLFQSVLVALDQRVTTTIQEP
jgi:hypothetical protein